MNRTIRRRMHAIVVLCLLASACAGNRPPNLGPDGVVAFNQLRIEKALGLVRDAATTANETLTADCALAPESPGRQCRPLLSEDTTRKVVEYHRSAIVLVHGWAQGWTGRALAALEVLERDLPEKDAMLLAPYLALVKMLVNGVNR